MSLQIMKKRQFDLPKLPKVYVVLTSCSGVENLEIATSEHVRTDMDIGKTSNSNTKSYKFARYHVQHRPNLFIKLYV